MRGSLQAILAAIRAYRRSDERRRKAVDATWARLAERNWAKIGAHPDAGPRSDEVAGSAPRSRARRSVIASGAAMALVAAGLVAILLGASQLNERAQPGGPYSPVDPHSAAPAASLAAGTSGRTTGPVPATVLPDASAPRGAATGTGPAAAAATGSTSAGLATPPVTSSPTATGTVAASASPSLLDLCRTVVATGTGWPSVIKGADRKALIAAAGTKKNVLPYCTGLVG